MDRLILKYPVAVEGKYDKNKLSRIVGSPVIALNGFAVFRDADTLSYLRAVCRAGLIVLTDSDRAGFFIRNKLKGLLPGADIINVYIPCVEGKERRKRVPSKDGLLGVEGMESAVLRELLLPFAKAKAVPDDIMTKADMYALGLSGGDNASHRRALMCAKLGLPESLGANALLEYINLFIGKEAAKVLALGVGAAEDGE